MGGLRDFRWVGWWSSGVQRTESNCKQEAPATWPSLVQFGIQKQGTRNPSAASLFFFCRERLKLKSKRSHQLVPHCETSLTHSGKPNNDRLNRRWSRGSGTAM